MSTKGQLHAKILEKTLNPQPTTAKHDISENLRRKRYQYRSINVIPRSENHIPEELLFPMKPYAI